MPARTRAALAPLADVWLHESASVNLAAMLATLRADYGVKRLVCEGGAQIFRALLTAGLVDELHATLCPRLFGGEKAPTITGLPGAFLPSSVPLVLKNTEVIGGECFVRYRVLRAASLPLADEKAAWASAQTIAAAAIHGTRSIL